MPGPACCAEAPHICPCCQRVMSHREAAELGHCDDLGAPEDVPAPRRGRSLREWPPPDAWRTGPNYRGP